MKLYQPCNGTEGDWFISKWCGTCVKEAVSENAQQQCDIVFLSMSYSIGDAEYPKQWVYSDNDEPMCTAYKNRDEYNRERRDKRKKVIASTNDTKTGDLFNEKI